MPPSAVAFKDKHVSDHLKMRRLLLFPVVMIGLAHATFTATPNTMTTPTAPSSEKSAMFATPPTTTATTMPSIPTTTTATALSPSQSSTTSVTNLTLAVNIEQRLDKLDNAVGLLQQQHLNLKIKRLTQQLADLRTLVEMEGQELLASNQRLQRLETQMQRAALRTPTQTALPIGNNASVPVVKSSHHQVMEADSMATIKASIAYHSAVSLAREKKYSQAIPALQQFIHDYPHSSDAPSAYFWLGNLQAIAGNSAQAQTAFMTLVKKYPKSLRRPDALMKLAQIAQSNGDTVSAKKWLETVMVDYPTSRSAALAKQHLQQIP